jgi:hypothetical protein
MTTDKEHLQWLLERFVEVHKESRNYDYIQRLQKIVDNTEPELNLHLVSEILNYEINSSWWAGLISNKYLQNLASSYFAWKVKRKHDRYTTNMKWKGILKSSR